jgi:hypothetical protein
MPVPPHAPNERVQKAYQTVANNLNAPNVALQRRLRFAVSATETSRHEGVCRAKRAEQSISDLIRRHVTRERLKSWRSCDNQQRVNDMQEHDGSRCNGGYENEGVQAPGGTMKSASMRRAAIVVVERTDSSASQCNHVRRSRRRSLHRRLSLHLPASRNSTCSGGGCNTQPHIISQRHRIKVDYRLVLSRFARERRRLSSINRIGKHC